MDKSSSTPEKAGPNLAQKSSFAQFKFYTRIYQRLVVTQLRTFVEYRGDFWIGILGAVLSQGASLVFIGAIFSRIPNVAGWSRWEVALLYGFSVTAHGAREMVCDGPWRLRRTLNRGEFDRLLIRPLPPFLQTATLSSSIHGAGNFLLGLTVIVTAANHLSHDWTILKGVFVVLNLLSSVVILGCIAFCVNIVSFWQPGTSSAFPLMLANLIELVKFPIELYSLPIQIGLSTVLPFAFVSYYPTVILLDKQVPLDWLGYCTPLVAVWTTAVTFWLWSMALNHYQGVGH